jgi:SAM-dependent methyltransferase
VSDVWSGRAQLYAQSEAHRSGGDLDAFVEWAAGARTALDVATGGGHVARRLREAGLDVVTADAARGMGPDVIAPAEDLPFADGAFDVAACRVAAHHFDDVPAAVRELARVARLAVLVADNLFLDEAAEEADRLRDPSHVRNLTPEEWHEAFAAAGLRAAEERRWDKAVAFEPWLERTGCVGAEAERVRELLGDRVGADGRLHLDRAAWKAVRA